MGAGNKPLLGGLLCVYLQLYCGEALFPIRRSAAICCIAASSSLSERRPKSTRVKTSLPSAGSVGLRAEASVAQDLFRLDGKTAFVSGARGHLGAAMAETLAAAGAHVIVNGRDPAALEDFAQRLRAG